MTNVNFHLCDCERAFSLSLVITSCFFPRKSSDILNVPIFQRGKQAILLFRIGLRGDLNVTLNSLSTLSVIDTSKKIKSMSYSKQTRKQANEGETKNLNWLRINKTNNFSDYRGVIVGSSLCLVVSRSPITWIKNTIE